MSVIIEEINAEVESSPSPGGNDTEMRPAEPLPQQELIDLLELTGERRARLVVD